MTRRPAAQPAQVPQLLPVPPIPNEIRDELAGADDPLAAWLWQVAWTWTSALGVETITAADTERWAESWPAWRTAPMLVGLADARAVLRARYAGAKPRQRDQGRRR